MIDFHIKHLVVIGVGLIGGSFAAALKKASKVDRVTGLGRSRGNLEQALRLGLIDEIGADSSSVRNADFVLLAVPMGQMGSALENIAPHLSPKTIVTDAGSTKSDVVETARKILGARFSHFVPAHPIAGAEHSGAAAARADLFSAHNVILTPEPQTDRSAVESVYEAWRLCGARIVAMPAAEHDRILATVSHLPHVLAYALVNQVASQPNADTLFTFAAGGFRDFTRIASSSAEMWRDICIANRDALLKELRCYREELDRLTAYLETGDSDALGKIFSKAREARNNWLKNKL